MYLAFQLKVRPRLRRLDRHRQPVAVYGASADALDGPVLRLPPQQPQRCRPLVRLSHRPHGHGQGLSHGGMAHVVPPGLDGALGELQDADVGVSDIADGALLPEPLAPVESLDICQHPSPLRDTSRQDADPPQQGGLAFSTDYAKLDLRDQFRFGSLSFGVAALCFCGPPLAHIRQILATIGVLSCLA